jgi:hypothetical protein
MSRFKLRLLSELTSIRGDNGQLLEILQHTGAVVDPGSSNSHGYLSAPPPLLVAHSLSAAVEEV